MPAKTALFHVEAADKPRFLNAAAKARVSDGDVRAQFFDTLALAVLAYTKDAALQVMEQAGFSGSQLGGIW